MKRDDQADPADPADERRRFVFRSPARRELLPIIYGLAWQDYSRIDLMYHILALRAPTRPKEFSQTSNFQPARLPLSVCGDTISPVGRGSKLGSLPSSSDAKPKLN